VHDLIFDHVHIDEEDAKGVAETIWNADNVVFTTVGVDVGSSTSHLMFARVHLQRMAEALSSRFLVVEREILWRSPILLTPYRPDFTIDAAALQSFIDRAYREADLTREQIDTGAVILTGEALKRTNARAIADLFSAESGKFVCASAGHHLEALMAAHGSGAVAISRTEHKTLLNVDIGGGTTKLAIMHGGVLLDSAAVAVGGRLVAFDPDGRMVRIEEPAQRIAADIGLTLTLGETLSDGDRARLIARMVEVLVGVIGRDRADGLSASLMVTDPLPTRESIDSMTFSGGVSEYIYGRETADHGDLGRDLAAALSAALGDKRIAYPVLDPGQGIRATVVGASQFTVQVSGNTVYTSNPGALPIRNVPVVRLDLRLGETIDPASVEDAIRRGLSRLDLDESETTVALAFQWMGEPSYERLFALAHGIHRGLASTIAQERPLVLVMEGDVAKVLGRLLHNELDVKSDIVSLDGIQLREFDFIDIGNMVQPTNVVPIVIKSLLFSSDGNPTEFHRRAAPDGDGHEHGHGHSHNHGHDHGHDHGLGPHTHAHGGHHHHHH
jgi:ethanolamine utilization protein EutA